MAQAKKKTATKTAKKTTARGSQCRKKSCSRTAKQKSISKEESAAFTNVTKNQNKLNCGGYLFKGFEIRDLDSSDIQYMNDDVFVMPGPPGSRGGPCGTE